MTLLQQPTEPLATLASLFEQFVGERTYLNDVTPKLGSGIKPRGRRFNGFRRTKTPSSSVDMRSKRSASESTALSRNWRDINFNLASGCGVR